MLRSTFWPAKLNWLRRSQPKLFRRVAYWVSPSDWIFYTMFGDLKCSPSMASGTGFYNLKKNTWDVELMDRCKIPASALPLIADQLDARASRSQIFDTVFCPIGDGAASNLGCGADQPSVAAINVGTSAAVRTIQPRKSIREHVPHGLFQYIVDVDRFVIGGAVSNAGNLRQWCLRELRIDADPAAQEGLLSRNKAATDLLTVLPFWVEERAPTWPEGQLGVIAGLNQSISAAEIARAAAMSVFYRIGQILHRIEISLGRMRRVIVSGGILQSPASVRLLADAIGRDLEISAEPEASLRGAAVHALSQSGITSKTPSSGKTVQHDRALSKQHRERNDRQLELEKIMAKATSPRKRLVEQRNRS